MRILRSARRLAATTTLAMLALTTGGFAADRPEWLPEGSLGTALPTLADPTGLRQALWTHGIKFQLNYIGEVQSVVSGGLARGTKAGGRLELVIDADLEKMFGWSGATFHANGYQIHGTGISRNNLGNLMAASNIEALPSTRLFELWLEQKFAGDKVGLRFGQLAADTEFVTSSYAGLFINGTFGWPTIHAVDLPSGGPAYPLATPGVRLSLNPTDKLAVLLGLFNGDPAGPGTNDPQERNRHGTNFRLRDPALLIGEAQYKYGDDKSPDGLSGTVKLGAWHHFGRFGDVRYGVDGLSIADPAGLGQPLQRRGNSGIYGVLDQQVYRVADDPQKGIGIFARIGATPSDRNVVDLYADAGINFTGMIASRPDDAFGLAVAYAHVSRAAASYNSDMNFYTGAVGPVRSSEALLELTYSAQIMPGWTIQPNLQYIVRPGGNVVDPSDPLGQRAVPNATVLGVRTTLKY